jgi:CopA family copper-resistance protein
VASKRNRLNLHKPARNITRRRFVQGIAAGGLLAAFDLYRWPSLALAAADPAMPQLAGTSFDLAIQETPVNFSGTPAIATAVNGTVPGPILRWREGDTVTLSVTNRLEVTTSIHWHGIRAPADMDGVPGLSFAGIAPGETFVYRIPVRQSGTYWYHSHSGFQEQTGLYGPLIIDPRGADPIACDREYIAMLSDWTDDSPDRVFSNLKIESDYYNYGQRTVGTFISDTRKNGLGPTVSDRMLWNGMNMSPTDLSDVSGATYTYLLNGHSPQANWTALFHPHERVRLRFINGSAMSIFDVRIPGLPMTVVQTDGNDVEPVPVDEFRIAVAETYDVIVEPAAAAAFTIFAQALDRSGYARATLAPHPGMTTPVPSMDPRPILTMVDMGMGNMSAMGSGQGMGAEAGQGMNGQMPAAMPGMPGMGGMTGNNGGMAGGGGAMNMRAAGTASVGRAPAYSTGTMPFPQPGPDTSPPSLWTPGATTVPARQIVLRKGPEVDNVAKMPTERLNRPGTGLNHNGRRVLTYSDLRARYRGVDPRVPDRDIELHLTGNMERFIWGFDGKKFSDADPIRLRLGERVRFILINDTMMQHPIHLHGLWSELENGQGDLRPYKHTINVKPGERLSYLVSADTPGRWAYHCHLSYHMEAGMFREVIVS